MDALTIRQSIRYVLRTQKVRIGIDLFKYALVMGLLAWIAIRGATSLGYNWQWYRIPDYIYTYHNGRLAAGPLLEGLWVTFQITGASMGLCFAIGLITALFRLSQSFSARALAWTYVELIRNTPLLIQIFFCRITMWEN